MPMEEAVKHSKLPSEVAEELLGRDDSIK